MARRSTRVLRLAVLAVALIALSQLAFVAAPKSSSLRGHEAAAAAAAGIVLLAPVPALAVEQTFDGWGAPELTATALPLFFVIFLYLDWESKQEPTDNVTGFGTLGKQVDGPTPDQPLYFRRSPEHG
jgi:uncharacterized membrane protein